MLSVQELLLKHRRAVQMSATSSDVVDLRKKREKDPKPVDAERTPGRPADKTMRMTRHGSLEKNDDTFAMLSQQVAQLQKVVHTVVERQVCWQLTVLRKSCFLVDLTLLLQLLPTGRWVRQQVR